MFEGKWTPAFAGVTKEYSECDNINDGIDSVKRVWKIVKRLLIWVPVTALVALTIFALTPLGRYLVRAGIAEARILLARRPIPEAIADPSTGSATRRKLELVVAARTFAQERLSLAAGKSFTQFTQLDRDTLVLVLSAAPKDQLLQYTWSFPIVGRLPYKGYFDYEEARREAKRMADGGYDINLRPAAAFSTLGWFNDPVLSTTLAADSIDIIDTVIHELTHNTFFAKGQGTFNESFANFVGSRGSAFFFESRGDTASAREARDRWDDQQVLGQYWAKLYGEMDSVFKAHPTDKELRLRLRDSVYSAARRVMVDSLSKELKGVPVAYLERVRLDNAALMGRRVYATDLPLFDSVLRLENGDLKRAIERVIIIAKANPKLPAAALRDWVSGRPPGVRVGSALD